jgi:hypothetical protein
VEAECGPALSRSRPAATTSKPNSSKTILRSPAATASRHCLPSRIRPLWLREYIQQRSTNENCAMSLSTITRGTRYFSQAVLEKEHRGVADPDQAYILGELIRYLEHPRSGALEFDDMGTSWVPVRNAVSDGTLRASNPGAADIANRFDALLRFTALQLGTRLGTEATVVFSRKDLADPASRTSTHVANLVDHGRLVLQGQIA